MLAEHLCLPLVVFGNRQQALHPLGGFLPILAAQPHEVRLEARFGANEAALAQGLQRA
ncbi:hypothetical protein D3C79_759430 [compost metagenome]